MHPFATLLQMREGRIYSGGSASMIEKLFQCDSDDVMYIGPPPFSFSLSHTRMTSDSLSERASECFPHWHTFPRCRQQVRYDQYIQLLDEHTFPRSRRVHLRNRLRIGVRVSEIAYSRRICPRYGSAAISGVTRGTHHVQNKSAHSLLSESLMK